MAVININIPDNQLDRVIDGICLVYRYRDTINGQPNPETKAQFAKRMILGSVKNMVSQAEAITARDTAKSEITLS